MMYIRTKYGIHLRKIFDKECSNEEWESLGYSIIKQADTIKDLLDEFVKVPVNEKPHLIFADAVVTYKSIITGDVQTNITPFEIYGAIWSDKGLIYVAKMNEQGEFELI